MTNVELGVYTPDPTIAPAARFQPSGAAGANAARVTMTHQQPLFFGGIMALAGGNTGPAQTSDAITTQAMASARTSLISPSARLLPRLTAALPMVC